MIPTRFTLPLVALALGTALGLGLGWKLYRPKPAPIETAAPEVRQKDGSLVLERKPEAKPQPMHELPKGAKLERQVQVTVLPNLPSIPTGGQKILGSGSHPEFPDSSVVKESLTTRPITVDLSLVKMPDGTSRVIASSPDGVVTGGLDIPAGPPAPVLKLPKWEAGALWNPGDHTYGAFLTHAAGPFVLGAEVYQERASAQAGGGTTLKAMVAIGIRW